MSNGKRNAKCKNRFVTADLHGWSRIKKDKEKSVFIRVNPWLAFFAICHGAAALL
jgi:hypothetical protein